MRTQDSGEPVGTGTRVIVTTFSGGCGGLQFAKRAFPAGTKVEQTETGELVLHDDSGTLFARFSSREWIDWTQELST